MLKRAGADCRQWLYRCSPPAIVEIATLNASALLVIYLALYIYYIHRRAPHCAQTLPTRYVVTYLALYIYLICRRVPLCAQRPGRLAWWIAACKVALASCSGNCLHFAPCLDAHQLPLRP